MTFFVSGKTNLPTDRAFMDIHVIEPHFKVKIKGKRLSFSTRRLRTPELILAKFATIEHQAAHPNGRIDVNEIIDLKFAIQNIGEGDAKNVAVNVNNAQNGGMLMGIVYGEKVVGRHTVYETLGPGNYKTAVYRYFINSEFSDKELDFRIQTSEERGKYGFVETRRVGVNTALKEEGRIHRVKVDKDRPEGKVIIEDIPEFEVDIEKICQKQR